MHSIYKERLLLRCIHHFKENLINSKNRKRILGTESSSVILSQTKYFQKLKSNAPKVSEQAEVIVLHCIGKFYKCEKFILILQHPKFYHKAKDILPPCLIATYPHMIIQMYIYIENNSLSKYLV